MSTTFRRFLMATVLLYSASKGFSQDRPAEVSPVPPPPGNIDQNGQMRGNHNPEGNNGNPMEKMENKKNMFLVKRLQLNSEEAGKFLPLRKKYAEELLQLRMKSRTSLYKAMNDGRDSIKISIKDQNKLLDNEMQLKQQEIELAKKYNEEYKKIMPPIKVAELYDAEEKFAEQLLNKEMRDQNRNDRRNADHGLHSAPLPPPLK